jgi:hypothetical protein
MAKSAGSGGQAINIPYAMVVRVIDPLKGKYQVEVENTNPTKSIYSFNWRPPGGLTITKITGNSNAACHLPGDGSITCTGKIAASKGNNHASASSMIVDFDASGLTRTFADGYYTYYGVLGAISVQQGSNDLPACKKGTQSTVTHLCSPS